MSIYIKEGNWLAFPKAIYELGENVLEKDKKIYATAISVFGLLLSKSRSSSSQASIAKELCLDRRKVRLAINFLLDYNIIEKEYIGNGITKRASKYKLMEVNNWRLGL